MPQSGKNPERVLANVLVFPSSNEPGLECVHALMQHPKFSIVGASSVDAALDASSRILARHRTVPMLGEDGFWEAIEALIREEEIGLIFATTDTVVEAFANNALTSGLLIGPSAETAHICASKTRTADAVGDVVRTPVRYETDDEVVYPAYAKRDTGGGGRGAMVVDGPSALAYARDNDRIVIEYLPGPEYTVDCASDPDGELLGFRIRERTHVGRGIALAGKGHRDDRIDAAIREINARLNMRGPWFAQFRERADGTPILMEVNARVGGSMGMTRLAGMNIPLMLAFSFLEFLIDPIDLIEPCHVVRSLDLVGDLADFDLVIWDLDDTLIRPDGRPNADAMYRVYDLHNQGKRQVVLSKNPDPHSAMSEALLPEIFESVHSVEDKFAAVDDILETLGVAMERAILINDSMLENLGFTRSHPTLRWITPDRLGILAREHRR